MPVFTGSCFCREIEYKLELESTDDARASICHCRNCKVPQNPDRWALKGVDWNLPKQKAFGTNYGLTAKVPKNAFHLKKGKPKQHAADNGSGAVVYREFCDNCGSFILEYGVNNTSASTLPSTTYLLTTFCRRLLRMTTATSVLALWMTRKHCLHKVNSSARIVQAGCLRFLVSWAVRRLLIELTIYRYFPKTSSQKLKRQLDLLIWYFVYLCKD